MEELEQEELDKELLNTGKTPVTDLPTPAVPTFEPSGRGKGIFSKKSYMYIIFINKLFYVLAKTKVEEDDDEMKELANWAS